MTFKKHQAYQRVFLLIMEKYAYIINIFLIIRYNIKIYMPFIRVKESQRVSKVNDIWQSYN